MTLPRLKVKPNPKPKESGKQAPKMLKPRKRKRSRLKTSLLKSKVNLLLDANANDPRLQVKKSRKRFLLLLLSPRRVKALRASRSPNLRLRLRKPRKKSGLRLSLNRSQTIRGADNDVTPTNLMKVGRKSLSLDLMSQSQRKLKNFPRKRFKKVDSASLERLKSLPRKRKKLPKLRFLLFTSEMKSKSILRLEVVAARPVAEEVRDQTSMKDTLTSIRDIPQSPENRGTILCTWVIKTILTICTSITHQSIEVDKLEADQASRGQTTISVRMVLKLLTPIEDPLMETAAPCKMTSPTGSQAISVEVTEATEEDSSQDVTCFESCEQATICLYLIIVF